nr:hypothetical protein [uncultured Chryseobacterium sp.]
MKKLFLLLVTSAVLFHSCSSEREEEINSTKPEHESMKTKLNLKNIGIDSKVEGSVRDSINSSIPLSIPPAKFEQDESEIIPPGDVKPPKGN